MHWSELWNKENEPTLEQVKEYVGTPLLEDLLVFLQKEYKVKPKLSFSNCSMDQGIWKGWNIKFKKSGKSLCTVYPQKGHLLSLVPVGNKEMQEVDKLVPTFDSYTQSIYNDTPSHIHGKSLAIEITSESILDDVKTMTGERVKSK